MASDKLKPVTDLSLEELLQSVEETKEKPEDKLSLDDVSSFLAAYKIDPGEHKVRKPFLYEFYRQWSKDPVGKYTFYNRADKFFEPKNGYYLLDKNAFEIVDKIRQLKKADNLDFTKSQKYKHHIEFFFAVHGIKKGDFYIHCDVLEKMYRAWCIKNHYRISLRKWRFQAMCRTYFEFKNTIHGPLFKVNVGIVKYLSKKQLEKVNNGTYGKEED